MPGEPVSQKKIGLGVGLRSPHFPIFLNPETRPAYIQWVEVVSENFMDWQNQANPRAQKTLSRIREILPVALHGVSLNLGSADPLNQNYLGKLKSLVDQSEPLFVSDHLCWTGVDGINLHDLNPIPYTQHFLNYVSDRISKVQDFLKRPLLIENVSSYVTFKSSEMREEEFLTELVRKTDCRLLLDINNVFVSASNHGWSAEQFLKSLPHQKVSQVHVAGHTTREDGFLIDTHDHPVRKEVLDLTRWYADHFGIPCLMLERDAHIPEWSEMEVELLKLKDCL